jgi:hypothetical protein
MAQGHKTMEQSVKLTIRIPSRIHRDLKQRAYTQGISLNTAIIDALNTGLVDSSNRQTSERQRAIRMLYDSGMLTSENDALELVDVQEKNTMEYKTHEMTHKELRERLKGVPPLSEIIIQEREPR